MLATVFFYANVYLGQNSGYFDGAAETKPLLHMWSLGVEEQFYLILPLLLIVSRRWKQSRQLDVLMLIGLASLATSEIFRRLDESANFFFTPSRVWELLVGSCAATLMMKANGPLAGIQKIPRELLAASGLTAILISILVMNANTPSPSFHMLTPTIGAAILLMYGSGTLTAKLLSAKPMLLIGMASYSIYLWHQPVMAFSVLFQDRAAGDLTRATLVAVSILLGWISWYCVETPFRTKLLTSAQKTLAASVVCLVALGTIATIGFTRVQLGEAVLPKKLLDSFKPPARTKECFDIPYAHNKTTGWTCDINPSNFPPSFMLFGDSHALQLLDAVSQAARDAHRSGLFAGFSGCAPLLGVYPLTRRNQTINDCKALNDRVLHLVKEKGIRDVILVAKWSYYNTPWQHGAYLNAIGLTPGDVVSLDNSQRTFREGLRRTVAAYESIGVNLHLIEQVPQQTLGPNEIYQRAWHGESANLHMLRSMSVSTKAHQQHQSFSTEAIHEAVNNTRAHAINLDHLFCNAGRCLVGTGEVSYYQDKSHLSQEGALITIPYFTDLLRSTDAPQR